MTKVNRK